MIEWKKQQQLIKINNIIKYFLVITLSKNNKEIYLTLFYLSIIFNLFISIIIIYTLFKFYKNENNVIYPVKILTKVFPYTSTFFFLPIIFTLTSIIKCSEDQTNIFSNELKCYNIIYYLNSGISIINIILFSLFNIVYLMLGYDYSFSGNLNVLSKSNSKPDVFFGISKIVLTIFFIFIGNSENSHYFLISICVFVSLTLMYLNFIYPRFNNYTLVFMNQFLSLSFFWASFILLIGRFNLKKNFNGCLGIFFSTVPIFFLILIFKKKNIPNQIIDHLGKDELYKDYLNNIKSFIYLIENKDNLRNAFVLLKGYIILFEENCIYKDCSLKKYINSIKFGNNGNPFLLQHAELLFNSCISRFPKEIEVKFAYAFFLIEKMNKKKKASDIIKGIDILHLSIEHQFIIYKCNKILEDDFSNLNTNNLNLDMIKKIKFKNLKDEFLNLINEAINLYIDFWSQLFISHSSGAENLTKLNKYGKKINIIIEQIHSLFEKIQKIKNNDYEIIKIYYDFINDILNDKDKALLFKKTLDDLIDNIESKEDIELSNVNYNTLSLNDKFQYIIVSAKNENFGTIINISLNISSLFGYEYEELIGKNLDIIMPEIYHQEHKNILKKKLNEFKKKELEDLNKKDNNKKQKEIFTFGITKSKYLIELHLKPKIMRNENNEIYFITSISKDYAYYHTNHIQENTQYCYILTNKLLYIQNFTANGVSFLSLSSGVINNNIEITFFIKQLHEEYLQIAIEYNNQLTSEEKLKIKRKIIKKYKNPMNIIWRRSEVFDSKFINSPKLEFKSSLIGKTPKFNYNNFDFFNLMINEIIINGKLIGYIFRFEKLNFNSVTSTKDIISSKNLLNKQNSIISNSFKIDDITPKRKNYSNDFYKINTPKNDFQIDSNFIPDSNFNFKLNIDYMSYTPNTELSYSYSVLNEMKKFVYDELEKKNKKLENISNNEEENEEEEDEENSILSSNYSKSNSSSSNNKSNLKKTRIINLTNIPKNKQDDDYYKVNFSKIKYLIFDFSKNILKEIKDWEKCSYVEIRMNEGKKIKTNNENKESKEENDFLVSLNSNENNYLINNNENKNQDNNIIKEIEYALKKKENLESISLLNKMSIVIFLLFILIGIFVLFYIIEFSKEVKHIGTLVMNSYRLLIFNSIGAYYVRELTLLNNENYTSIPSKNSKENYTITIINETLSLFEQIHNLLSQTAVSNIKISKKNKKILFEDQIDTENIQNDFSIKITKATMQTSFIEASTALFNIATKNISEIIPTEQDTFFYLKNSLNILSKSFYIQGECYMDELHKIIKKIEIICIIEYVIILLILIFIYFIISYSYDKVSHKKESYIEVFFQIGISVIKNSLEKCENLSKKLKNEEDEFDDSFIKNEDKISFIKNEENIIEKQNINQSNIDDRNNRNSQLTKLFKIRFGIFLIFIFIYITILFILYYFFLEKVKIMEKYFQQELIIENEFYVVFNSLREYLFDFNSTVQLEPSQTLLLQNLEYIYVLRRNTFSYMNEHRNKLPYNFKNRYNYINDNSPCNFKTNEYFSNDEECLHYINNATQFGYTIMNSYFIEEIRFAKEISVVVIDTTQKLNNLTLTGTELGKSLWPTNKIEMENYIKNDPINYFNYYSVNELNIVMNSLMIPSLGALKQITIDVITKYLKDEYFKFVIMMIVYLCFFNILFLFIWVPFVRNLNLIIYQTKNMLSIIPKEVLANISNIDKLLDLDKSIINSNNKNTNQ